MHYNEHRCVPVTLGLSLLLLGIAACRQAPVSEETVAEKIPITTASEEARHAFMKGRDLQERLRGTDAHEYFQQAVELDPDFAWAHLLAGFTGSTAQEFFDSLERAVAAAEKASEAERHLILATNAGVKGDPEGQREHLTRLIEAYPRDERAHLAMAGYYFGRQEWDTAVEHYQHAIDIDPDFSQPYNQKGYAHRFLGDLDAAEASFQKYIELIPDDPNPYDSYAELLMKMGRFEESIENYRRALGADQNFVASYVGIANNQMFLGQTEEARATLAELSATARNVGETRQALLWTARSYLHEGNHEQALETCRAMQSLAETDGDLATVAGDYNLMGDILLDGGRAAEAAAMYAKSIEAIEQADVADEVKENAKRNILFDRARAALAQGDLDGAKATAASYGERVAARQIPFEVRQHHELMGLIALEEGDHAGAAAHLEQANQQNPEVLFLLARAHHGQGNADAARDYCDQAASFNALSSTYAYIRAEAQEMLAGL